MIAVRLGPPPPKLVTAAAAELERARAHYGNPANRGKEFTFTAYKLDEVKEALNEAFNFKCAYCESYFGATQPLDVEHFRPKGGVRVDGQLRWGLYYWLAGAWTNLLPSCIDCNRSRRQRLADGTTESLGKANQFPLADESRRAASESEERNERRLLINPRVDRPPAHIAFDTSEGLVLAKSAKGTASVRVYGLLRDGLVRARKQLQIEIRTHIVQARRLAQKLEDEGSDPDLEAMLVEEIAALERFVARDHPYSALAHRLVDPVLEELLG